MSAKDNIKAVVAESSNIIRSGIVATLRHVTTFSITSIEVISFESLRNCIQIHHPEIVFIEPYICRNSDIDSLREISSSTKFIAIISSVINNDEIKAFDATISIKDDVASIASTIERLVLHNNDSTSDNGDQLSQREKEIIIHVVKGLTNKEIAEKLYISVHTVITHRRNISKKLEIHSPAGLTIYAIVNKLVELDEIKSNI